MKRFLATLCTVLAACPTAGFAALEARQSSPSWAGTNLYYLQGLSDAAQDAYIQKLSEYNTKVVRLWVNAQSRGCQKGSNIVKDIPPLETTIGQYNKVTLDELDKVMVKLVANNIKTIISPHDSNSLIGDYRKYVESLLAPSHGYGIFGELMDCIGTCTMTVGERDTSMNARMLLLRTMLDCPTS